MVELLKRIAERKRATPAEIALAWLLAQKLDRTDSRHAKARATGRKHIGAVSVDLSDTDFARDSRRRIENHRAGARLPEEVLKLTNR